MIALFAETFRDVCIEFIEDDVQKDLKKFVLAGKECFLAYIDILKTVDEIEFDGYGIIGVPYYASPPDWVKATLGPHDPEFSIYITDDGEEWRHALMLLGRYGKKINLPYEVVYPFYNGLAQNEVATEVRNCNLPGDIMVLEALQKHRAAKKIPPLEKIGVCLEFFHELAKMPKCHLKVNKCDIYETDTFSQYIRSKNLTVEELHVDSFDMKNFADIRYQSAVKQLSPNLKKVKKISLDSRCMNHTRSCPVLALSKTLDIFKKIFPSLEDFEIKMLDHIKGKNGLPIRVKRIEEALKCKSYRNLDIRARITDSPFNKTTSIEELRKKFPNYEVSKEDDRVYPCFVLQRSVNSRKHVSLRIELPFWEIDIDSGMGGEEEEEDD